MPDWLLGRPLVIGLAIVGGIFSMLASRCQARENVPAQYSYWLGKVSYAFMAASIILFIVASMFGADS